MKTVHVVHNKVQGMVIKLLTMVYDKDQADGNPGQMSSCNGQLQPRFQVRDIKECS